MRAKQAGFNLVELMIALVIGLVLMVSITTMFVDTKVSANRSSTVSNLQQQAQLALQVLVEDVRAIGSFAEFSGEIITDVPNIVPGKCNIVSTVTGAKSENYHHPEYANWIFSFKAASAASAAITANVITDAPCLEKDHSMTEQSDVLSISRIRGAIIPTASVNAKSYHVAITPMQAKLFTGVTPNIANAEIYPYLHHTYFVQAHATDGTKLSRFSFIDGNFSNDLVVSNIEQIRIDFGVDTNGDGRPESYLASSNITDLMWRTNQLVSARIYVLARAKNKDLTLNNNTEYNKRFSPFTPTNDDNYRRFLLSTTVVIKNNMMAVTQ